MITLIRKNDTPVIDGRCLLRSITFRNLFIAISLKQY